MPSKPHILSRISNMNDLPQRTITAFVFAGILIGGIILSPYALIVLFGIINLFCLIELQDMVFTFPVNQPRSQKTAKWFIGVVGTLVYALQVAVFMNWLSLHWLTLLIPIIFLLFIKELFSITQSPFNRIAINLVSLIWISFPCALVVAIGQLSGSYQPFVIVGVIILIWANDVFAYLSGSLFGKNALFPRVSPNKTWEGSIGGAIFTLIFGYLIAHYLPHSFTLVDWLVISILVICFGGLGDLVESLFKRSLNIKDSGSALPGHGGFLDRFDALIFSVPFIFFYLKMMNF